MPTILVVDDERDLLMAFQAVLRHEGYSIRTATTPQKALESFEREGFDLVLLDIRLGEGEEMDGLELLRRMRAMRPRIKVVVVSAYLDLVTRQAALDAGALDCWPKPVTMQMLRDRTAQALAHPGHDQCALADVAFSVLRGSWAPCAGLVSAVTVSGKERVGAQEVWKIVQSIRDKRRGLLLCEKHIEQLKDEGLDIQIENPGQLPSQTSGDASRPT